MANNFNNPNHINSSICAHDSNAAKATLYAVKLISKTKVTEAEPPVYISSGGEGGRLRGVSKRRIPGGWRMAGRFSRFIFKKYFQV